MGDATETDANTELRRPRANTELRWFVIALIVFAIIDCVSMRWL
jgi:hypothetical protein